MTLTWFVILGGGVLFLFYLLGRLTPQTHTAATVVDCA
jgi:hypothetical protein